MSRRKQAKPRALKREEDWESDCGDKPPDGVSSAAVDHDASVVGDSGGDEQSSDAGANYDTSMDALQLALLERRGYGGGLPDSLLDGSRRGSPGETDNSLESDALGTSSWRSETPEEEGQTSPSPSSSATDVADADLAFTVGVTEGTPYACQFCDKAFPRLSYLKKHEQTHSDQMPFRCEFCSRLFKHKRSRDRHIKLHTGDKKYRCSHCEAAFSRSDHLKIHMKTHDNQKPFQCTVCNRGYNTAAALTSHMQNHKKESGVGGAGTPSPGSTFRCLSCGDAFRKPDDLQSHMASQHGSPTSLLGASLLTPKLACIYCTKDSFTTMEALQLHVQAMHGAIVNGDFSSPAASPQAPPPTPPPPSLPFACDLCTMRFASPSGLHKHAAAVHCAEQLRPTDLSKKGRGAQHSPPAAKRLRGGAEPPAAAPYDHPGTLLCNQCSAALPDFEAFRTHLKSHLLEETAGAVCRHCGAAFAGAEALWRHVGSHFLATASEFGCQSCLKQFRQPDDLQRHLLELHALHLYRCALCQELFESKVAIQVHFAVAHSSESRLFRCTACPGAAFRAEADFALHVRAAHAVSPTPATPPSQQQQPPPSAPQTAAPQQPPFRCLYCRLSFGSELEMQFHLAAHSKQFRCPVCHEAFHVEFLLDKHMASHHAAQILNGNSTTPDNLNHLQQPQQKSPKSKTAPARTSSGGSSSSDGPTSGVGDAEVSSDATSAAAAAATTTLDKLSGGGGKVKGGGGGSSSKGGGGGATAGVSLHCAYCSENCKSRTELENHMKTHSQGGAGGVGGKHKCNICDELCPSAAVLAEHKLTHCKVVAGNSCTQCKAALASEDQFVAHLRQHGGGGAGAGEAVALPTPCVVCRQTLMSDVEVRVHAKFHLQQPPPRPQGPQCCLCLRAVDLPGLCPDCAAPRKAAFRCLHCAASFDSERDVQRHVAGAHSLAGAAGERHECHLCRRCLDSPRQLQAHLIEHTFAGCGSFTCYLCSAVFTAAPGLQQHMLAHGPNARPYDCARCSLRFFFRAELDNHSYSHLERDEELATKMAYYQHLNNNGTSEGDAKGRGLAPGKGGGGRKGGGHACQDLGKEFSAARGLASHVRTAHHHQHHGGGGVVVKREGVHACGVCSKEFLDVESLDSHVAALHHPHAAPVPVPVKQEPPSPPPTVAAPDKDE